MTQQSSSNKKTTAPIEAVFTGISKIPYDRMITDIANAIKKYGKKITVAQYDVFNYMQKAAKEIGLDLSEKNVLHLPEDQIQLLRNNACQKIQETIQADADKEIRKNKKRLLSIITTHSCFYTKSGMQNSLHGHEKLLADYCFNVVHDVHYLQNELRNDNLHRWQNISLQEVIEWRDQDFRTSEAFAKSRGAKFFMLAVREPAETFLNVILERKMPRAYCSYPMTHAGSDTEKKVKKFIQKLRKYIVVFDPINVEEYGPEKEKLDNLRAQGKKVRQKSYKLLERIGEETVKRDFQLIKQSQMVIVYFPPAAESDTVEAIDKCCGMLKSICRGKKPRKLQNALSIAKEKAAQIMPLSPGVISEMAQAHISQKEVHGLWLNKKILPSPFFNHWCTEFFTSEKEFLKFLKMQTRNPNK